MGMHTELSIYKAAMGLLYIATTLTRNIPRDLKTIISAQVMSDCLKILTLIGRANSSQDKWPNLVLVLEKLHQVDLVMRLCKESRFITADQQSKTMMLTAAIGKQANAWKKKYNPTAPAI